MATRVMPIDDVGSPKLPHNGKLESKEKKSSEAKPGLSNKPSRFFFMDASGQLVDTTLALSAIIPAFKSSSMEDQYRKVAFSRWRSSPDLNLLAALLVILGALGSMGSWTLPGPFGLSSSRIFAALLTIALVVMLKFRKWALEPRTDRALLVTAVTFSVRRWVSLNWLPGVDGLLCPCRLLRPHQRSILPFFLSLRLRLSLWLW
jgi:hypothetical protein